MTKPIKQQLWIHNGGDDGGDAEDDDDDDDDEHSGRYKLEPTILNLVVQLSVRKQYGRLFNINAVPTMLKKYYRGLITQALLNTNTYPVVRQTSPLYDSGGAGNAAPAIAFGSQRKESIST